MVENKKIVRSNFALMVVAALIAVPAGATPKTGTTLTGEEIIREMHRRYAGHWYKDLTFIQRTTYYNPRTATVDSAQLWYESLTLGGNLRIDIAPLDAGNGIIFRNDSLYVFRNGQQAFGGPTVHPLLVLGFDIYEYEPEETISKLTALRFDLNKSYETTWQGRDVYVVGAESADDKSNQFWIDKERMVFVRSLQYNPNGNEREVQFNNYERLGGGWISPEVIFLANGRVTLVEEYGDFSTDIPLPEEIYQVDERIRLPWVKN